MQTKKLAKLLGISHQLCNRHKKRGMPCDSLEAATEWRTNNLTFGRTKSSRVDSNPGKHTNETQVINEKPIEDFKQEVNATQLDLETKNPDILYKNARALRTKAEALQTTAEYEKFIDSLVPLADVEMLISVRAEQFLDCMTKCAHRIAPELASKTDISEVENLLSREHRALLESFANLPPIETN